MLMPSGSARPFSTSRVCGNVRSETQNVVARADSAPRLHAMQQRHRLGSGRGLVQQRRGGDLHRGQIPHHRLEIEERFQPSLSDLGLIGRIGRVPRGVLEQVPQDDAGRDRAVITHADERVDAAILGRDAAQAIEILVLGLCRRQLQWLLQADALRQRGVDERIERAHANDAEHLG